MTAARAKVAASLANRGRPAMWANEQEAAELSGVGVGTFRARVKAWESHGFPQTNPENGRRSIPAILAFWRLPSNDPAVFYVSVPEDGPEVENWNGKNRDSGKRLAS